MASSWSLCLVSTANNSRKVIQVNPSSDTVQVLFQLAGDAFGGQVVESLKCGFPPKPLGADDATLLSKSGVSNQERVQVVLQKQNNQQENNSNKTAKSNKKSPKKTTGKGKKKKATNDDDDDDESETNVASPAATTTTRRSKRAAAQAATDSFAQVIKQQDKLMKAEQSKTKKSPAKRASGGATAINRQPKRVKTFTSTAPGRRLGDGAVVAAAAAGKKKTSSAKRTKTTAAAEPHQYEDISTGLLGALNDKGSTGRIMRKGIKSAVHSAYQKTQAVARLAALESRKPQESVLMEKHNDNSLHVKFQKGVQGRGYFEETVDFIPEDVLKEVIRAILKSEPDGLRPQNMALLSPRLLWSLAHRHWTLQQERQEQQDTPSPWQPFSVEEAYKQLLPECDWSFMRRRKEQLSAKAMENLRQEQAEQEDDAEEEENQERGEQVIHEVEQAMENLQQFDRQQRAERIASAAMNRRQRQQQAMAAVDKNAAWEIDTPSELDEDELNECIAAASQSQNPTQVATLVKGLVEWGSIHNWRELANQNPANLHALVVEHHEALNITQEQVSEWIGHARSESADEIMFLVCDGNMAHIELLRDKARAGTPKDLCVWKDMPDFLMEELGDDAVGKIALSDIVRCISHAGRALEKFMWLDWFVTPIQEA
ncbi:expressed unknown protein [Seminavis robusta]|uniref:Uncharacterized protein n=1 Tax=Seminavis robusta TaxID=568900 RepID=A0A9N8DFU3_9STRA|nr:expressed unknown protein [Seminavis robusta]|eukprot:Sro104_g052940.1 n/a (656) ;mRNA; r:81013-82980